MSRLRNIAALACTPVIVLTARDPKANEDRAIQAGASAFLAKPVDNDQLLAAIEQAI